MPRLRPARRPGCSRRSPWHPNSARMVESGRGRIPPSTHRELSMMKIPAIMRVGCHIAAAAWLATVAQAAEPTARTSYTAYRFSEGENWHMRSAGNAGATQWKAPAWSLDFSQGAAWLGVSPPDTCLLGRVDRIRLRARGAAKGHPVHLFLHTHFMTFHKVIGEFSGEGEQEIVTDGAAGPGLAVVRAARTTARFTGRCGVGEIRLEAAGQKDRCNLELLSLTIDGNCPAERRCVHGGTTQDRRRADRSSGRRSGHLSQVALEGTLHWRFRDWDRRGPRAWETAASRCRRSPATRGRGAPAGRSCRMPIHRGRVQPGPPRPESAAGPGVLAGPARRIGRQHAAAGVALRHGHVPGPLSTGAGDGAGGTHGTRRGREMVPRGFRLVAHRAAEGPVRVGLLRRPAGLRQTQRHLRLRHRRLLDALDQAVHRRGHQRLRAVPAEARRAVQERHPSVGNLERAEHLLLAGPEGPLRDAADQELCGDQGDRPGGRGAGPLHGRDRLPVHRANAGPEGPVRRADDPSLPHGRWTTRRSSAT